MCCHNGFAVQVRVLAQDGGTPSLSATATVNVQVRRNLFSPQFAQLLYETTILETQDLGVEILRVNATDADTKVSDGFHVL